MTCPCAACAAAGDADKAFLLYAEMKATGVPADRMVYSSVVKACAERIERLPPSERCASAHAAGEARLLALCLWCWLLLLAV